MILPVADRFYIEGSARPRPSARRVVYADGAGGDALRLDVDLELSHWVPNRTDERFKADTSTEICLRYVARPTHSDVDLVVNDHADVDGILSLYALLHPALALEHRDVLVAAAAMGDFHAAADRPGFRLAQELSTMLVGPGRPADIGDCYACAFEIVTAVLDGSRPESATVATGWTLIEQGHECLEREVTVERITDRLVAFVLPRRATDHAAAALAVPALNAVVDDSVWLWPEVRNRHHGERVHLVSAPHDDGWFHDVWAPSYCWAETPGRWPFPGLVSTGDSNRWRLDHTPLRHGVAELGRRETAPGRWTAADELTPFTTLAGRAFPVVASFVDDTGAPAPSAIPPHQVAEVLTPVW